MNEVMVINKHPALNKGQECLLKLFLEYYQSEKVIPKNEMLDIYKNHVGQGFSWSWDYKRDENGEIVKNEWGRNVTIDYKIKWDEYNWNYHFQGWFLRTLGSLLKKGYLKIVPSFELTDNKQLIPLQVINEN